MDILDPVGTTRTASGALADRPATLDRLVVGVLDNSKPNARVLLEGVAAALVARFGAGGVRVWHKPGSSVPASAGVMEEIAAGCGVLLTGSAD
jgi:hypothetical protein